MAACLAVLWLVVCSPHCPAHLQPSLVAGSLCPPTAWLNPPTLSPALAPPAHHSGLSLNALAANLPPAPQIRTSSSFPSAPVAPVPVSMAAHQSVSRNVCTVFCVVQKDQKGMVCLTDVFVPSWISVRICDSILSPSLPFSVPSFFPFPCFGHARV